MRRLVATVVISSACCPPLQEVSTTPAAPAPAPAPRPPVPAVTVAPPAPSGPPVARTVDVVDREHGLAIADPYRWMEGINNPEHDAWLRAQGEHATTVLDAIPGRTKLRERVRELGLGVSAVFNVQLGGKRLFHSVVPAGAQLAKLAVREPDGTSRTLVDPEALGRGGQHVSLEAWSPSPDGAYVSYVLSRGGGERGEIHVLDVATGKDLPEVIPRVWGEAAGSWHSDSKRFFYLQLPEPTAGVDPMTNQIVRAHVLGTNVADDPVVIGRGPDASWKLAPEEWPGLWHPRGSQWVLTYGSGARNESRIGVAKLSELDTTGASKTPWRPVSEYADLVHSAVPHGDRLYILTSKGAPNRRLVSVPLDKPALAAARVEIPEDPAATLVSMHGARDALYLVHMVNGLARVSRWPWRGKATALALPFEGWTPDIATTLDRDGVTFQIETWLRPGTYFAYDPKTKQLKPNGLASTTTADTSSYLSEEVEATSADGTRVPLSILSLRDRPRDKPAPAIVMGYAAYGISLTAGFGVARSAWVERGGVYAICHARGGGEKGRRWQDEGSRDKKLAGIADFVACGEYLVANKYTTREQLAATGTSMGGVLAGRALTSRPDLFAAVHLGAPLTNPLRILAAENGANQKGELGDPATEAGYKWIAAMDPYVTVQPNTAYPAVIMTVGLNDHRVAPWMASKLAARLMAVTTSKKPIVLRVEAAAGHGIGSTRDQLFYERADVLSFFLASFGDPDFVAR